MTDFLHALCSLFTAHHAQIVKNSQYASWLIKETLNY